MQSPIETSAGKTQARHVILAAAIVVLAAIAGFFILRPAKPPGGTDGHAAAARPADEHGEGQTGKPEEHGHEEDHEKGPIAFSDEQFRSSGVVVETSAPGEIETRTRLPGEIRFNEDRTAHVVPRVAGVVESVSADLGQHVRKGQVLAVISSVALSEQRSELLAAQKRLALARTTADRERRLFQDKISAQQDVLQAEQVLHEAEIAVANAGQKLRALGAAAGSSDLARFELRAPFDGTVVEKHLAPGESVKEDANVFTVSDLSAVWARINVTAANLPLVKVGDSVVIQATGFQREATGKVSYVGALIGEQTRTAAARVALPNPGMAWRPGLFVTVELVTGKTAAPVTVTADAIQMVENRPTVYARVDGGFEARPVKTGRSDGRRVEILDGLAAGTAYAGKGSFVVKAQQGKGSSGHEH
ncbi:efflux RND transporter periplasmic adaptor subunit [Paracidovorax cattleyae]|uniref:Membrane fusion protein, cobalt-zinc-cadmium efflux system n=1 Tax=Paracidovorax cattleyae TaxID=80868 RepID=A0A1H0U738_9BURK|nr:efflux RND transporter periplasmic adaptor subunit [Paracidovorax cattleyae]AVS74676.1 efflux RND transporter periplasmic adaptor subunit [Paracidovorax cattleyae]MBF9266229.1 efflux RND transporter periplasmic adaptor subunit [Paracidovorax cattleyae]SDP61974.1 membrane fusion protein, cobalt-zinc-cadmium efflux system [Paracidovorax cattleyae]